MAVIFKIKSKHQGASQIDQYTGSNGKVAAEKIAGAIEDEMIAVKGRALLVSAKTQRERTLFMAAVFFQRVVSRTPVDEDYYFQNKKGDLEIHHKDDDAVRDAWVASYNNRSITAKQMREAGITFDKFNDESEIRAIYAMFREAFIMGSKNIVTVHIDNNHERFPMLEYGEYEHDGSLKKGDKYYHGVEGGYSVQAPAGMLRITQAEFQKMTLTMSTRRLIQSYVQRSQRTLKNPSPSKMKELKRILGNKTKFGENEVSAIERIYGV